MITHGMSNTQIYRSWTQMIQRCENPNNIGFKYYGGRGIKVCKRWHTFENFFADMGEPPVGKSLDRWPNNDGNYEPENCRWATIFQQAKNQRPKSSGHAKQYWFKAINLKTGNVYTSNNQHTFARQHKISASCISACLNLRREIYLDWRFEFLKN